MSDLLGIPGDVLLFDIYGAVEGGFVLLMAGDAYKCRHMEQTASRQVPA
jgi:hypothetical protein